MINFIGDMPALGTFCACRACTFTATAKSRGRTASSDIARSMHRRPAARDRPCTALKAQGAIDCERRRFCESAGHCRVNLPRNWTGLTSVMPPASRRPYRNSPGRCDVPRTLQTARTAVPAEPGPAVPVPVQAPCARQGVHGVDHLVHRWLRRHHRRDRLGQDHADRDLPERAREGRGRRADQPDAGHARSNSCSRCWSSSASRPSR